MAAASGGCLPGIAAGSHGANVREVGRRVGADQQDPLAGVGEPDRGRGGDRRLADPALAGEQHEPGRPAAPVQGSQTRSTTPSHGCLLPPAQPPHRDGTGTEANVPPAVSRRRARSGEQARHACAVIAGSVALLGFGLDSGIEALASIIVIWRFTGTRLMGAGAERRAQQLVAVSFYLLAPYIAAGAIWGLATGERAETSIAGLILTGGTAISESAGRGSPSSRVVPVRIARPAAAAGRRLIFPPTPIPGISAGQGYPTKVSPGLQGPRKSDHPPPPIHRTATDPPHRHTSSRARGGHQPVAPFGLTSLLTAPALGSFDLRHRVVEACGDRGGIKCPGLLAFPQRRGAARARR